MTISRGYSGLIAPSKTTKELLRATASSMPHHLNNISLDELYSPLLWLCVLFKCLPEVTGLSIQPTGQHLLRPWFPTTVNPGEFSLDPRYFTKPLTTKIRVLDVGAFITPNEESFLSVHTLENLRVLSVRGHVFPKDGSKWPPFRVLPTGIEVLRIFCWLHTCPSDWLLDFLRDIKTPGKFTHFRRLELYFALRSPFVAGKDVSGEWMLQMSLPRAIPWTNNRDVTLADFCTAWMKTNVQFRTYFRLRGVAFGINPPNEPDRKSVV